MDLPFLVLLWDQQVPLVHGDPEVQKSLLLPFRQENQCLLLRHQDQGSHGGLWDQEDQAYQEDLSCHLDLKVPWVLFRHLGPLLRLFQEVLGDLLSLTVQVIQEVLDFLTLPWCLGSLEVQVDLAYLDFL